MEGDFSGVFDTICENVNRTAQSLDGVVSKIAESSGSISGATEEIADAAMDLARRTEANAATLEQTASAIDELSSSVRSASSSVNGVNDAMARIRRDAESNVEVVDKTVAAMEAIKTSSSEIRKIVGLIDDIAFQTNLLALNAGVEAARAGESGRGFLQWLLPKCVNWRPGRLRLPRKSGVSLMTAPGRSKMAPNLSPGRARC